VAEVHEIPFRYVVVCPEGIGKLAAVHVVPESVSAMGVLEPLWPTDTQAVDDVQEIRLR
jgi:hypothetical protein